MTDSLSTVILQRCLDRLRGGDQGARDELVSAAAGRLERLARKMLHGSFERVARWSDTTDITQAAAIRLWAALATVVPDSPLHFHRLSALHVRRELLDLARSLYGPHGVGANHGSAAAGGSAPGPLSAAPAGGPPPDSGANWADFHELVSTLPPDEAAVTDLLFYQGLSQEDAGELLGVDNTSTQEADRLPLPQQSRRDSQSARFPGISPPFERFNSESNVEKSSCQNSTAS